MTRFETQMLPGEPDVTAPDGSDVRVLPQIAGASMAHFELPPGKTSLAVAHRTVEEAWFVVGGEGEMWRKLGDQEEVVKLTSGVALTIPLGTHFQFRATGDEPLQAVGFTVPPWPGEDEAFAVTGPWQASV